MNVQEIVAKADLVVDASGLGCPMPVVRAKKGIDSLQSGQIMVLKATDRGSLKDVPAWVQQTRHTLEETIEGDGEYIYVIRKG